MSEMKALRVHRFIEARLRMTLGKSFWYLGDAKVAAEQFHRARALHSKLGRRHPDTLMSMNSLANSYADLGRHAHALLLHEQTLALRKAKLGPDHPDTLISMQGLATSLFKDDRGAEAVPLIDDCVKRAAGQVVPPGLISGVVDLRLRHFAKTKDAAGCRATAELWEKLKRRDAGSLYAAACMRAVTAGVLRATDPSPKVGQEAAAEADRAMAWLTQAVAAGYKDAAHMKRDTDLDALRDRPEFKKLLAELEAGKEKNKQ